MKNLTKNSVANVAKVGVASALIGAGLFLSACGGDSTSKAEKFVKEQYPDATILSYDEAKKEFGLTKDKECLTEKGDFLDTTYHFIKIDNEFKVLKVQTRKDNGASNISKIYSDEKLVGNFKDFKTDKADCFN